MKQNITEYETKEVEKTVTDYETQEVEKEQYVSDLTGNVIPEDELVTLHANTSFRKNHFSNSIVDFDEYKRNHGDPNGPIREANVDIDECEYPPSYKDKSYNSVGNKSHGIVQIKTHAEQIRDVRTKWENEVHETVMHNLVLDSEGEIHLSVSEFAELSGIDEDTIEVDDELPKAYVETANPEVKTWVSDKALVSLLCILSILHAPLFYYGALNSTPFVMKIAYTFFLVISLLIVVPRFMLWAGDKWGH